MKYSTVSNSALISHFWFSIRYEYIFLFIIIKDSLRQEIDVQHLLLNKRVKYYRPTLIYNIISYSMTTPNPRIASPSRGTLNESCMLWHPPYNLDLSRCNCHVIAQIKEAPVGMRFDDGDKTPKFSYYSHVTKLSWSGRIRRVNKEWIVYEVRWQIAVPIYRVVQFEL